MNIQIDDKTLERLSAQAMIQNTTVENLAAKWLKQASKHHAEKCEDLERLKRIKKEGGVEHGDMMLWLKSQVAGSAQ